MRSTPLSALLNADTHLSPIVDKAERLAELQRVLVKEVPPGLERLFTVANIRGGIVVIHAAHQAAAAKMRYVLPRLLAVLQMARVDVKAVRIELQTPRPPTNGSRRPRVNVLSPQAADHLKSLAEKLPDSPLTHALRKLAKRSEG